MKTFGDCMKVGVPALAMAALTTFASTASALDLPFSQTAGFFAGNPTLVRLVGGGPAIPNLGGLEFSTAVLQAPGIPQGGLPPAPPNIWQGVAWGCLLGAAIPANCANGGNFVPGTGFPDQSANPARSSLDVQGRVGQIQEVLWTDVTEVTHFNKVIDARSNILRTVEIQSQLRLGADPTPVIAGGIRTVGVHFVETLNDGTCDDLPAFGAPLNPLGSDCDDFAVVSGLDLTDIFLPAGTPGIGNPVDFVVKARLSATPDSGALVCDGSTSQPPVCGGYAGPDVVIYTAEGSTNTLKIQALLQPAPPNTPLFVIGDVEPHAVGDVVNFWGAQWWKNNQMSGLVSKGVASFKGFASNAQNFCGGRWESRPGNSSNPPATIPAQVAIIVTDTVLKNGPNISGTIKQIVLVQHDGKYGPAPGHRGRGPVTTILCTAP